MATYADANVSTTTDDSSLTKPRLLSVGHSNASTTADNASENSPVSINEATFEKKKNISPDDYAIKGCLYSKEDVAAKVKDLGKAIDAHYAHDQNPDHKPLVVVCVLKGAYVFCADLMRALEKTVSSSTEFVRAESYAGTESCGKVEITIPLPTNIDFSDKDVLIVEDLIETGLTLAMVKDHLIRERGCLEENLKICCLIDKPFGRVESAPEVDFVGFRMAEKVFVLGYGTDFNQRYRNSGDVLIADKTKIFDA